MKHMLLAAMAAVCSLSSVPSFAQGSPWVASLRAGTLGAGPELMYHPKNSHWGVRVNFDTYNIGFNDLLKTNTRFRTMYQGADVSGVLHTTYSGNAKLMNGSVYGDYYPWKHSAFRLSGGLIFGTNGITMTGNASATGTGTLTRDFTLSQIVRGQTYTKTVTKTFSQSYEVQNAGEINGKGRYNPVAPYLGIGFYTALGGGFYMNGDLGAMFQTTTHISMRATGVMTEYPVYQKSLDEARSKVRHYMGYATPVYPVAMVGFGYRF